MVMDVSHIPFLFLSVWAVGRFTNGEASGNKKCSDLCAHLPACTSFKFESLRCECTLETKAKHKGIVSAFDMITSLNPSTKKFFKFLTLRRTVKDEEDKDGPDINAEEKFPDRRRHLMVIPNMRKRNVILLDLPKLTKVKSKMKIVTGIIAMTYMDSIKKLIVSKMIPSSEIASYDLKRKSYDIIIKRFAPKTIAVDSERKFIFFIHGKMTQYGHFRKPCYMYKIVIGFKTPSALRTFKHLPAGNDVSVDPIKQTLFCAFMKYIIEMSYNGTIIRRIKADLAFRGMCLDDKGQTLYYIKSIYIKGINLGSINKTETIRRFPKGNKGLIYYNNSLFVMSVSNQMFAVNLNSRTDIGFINLKLHKKLDIPMCTIP